MKNRIQKTKSMKFQLAAAHNLFLFICERQTCQRNLLRYVKKYLMECNPELLLGTCVFVFFSVVFILWRFVVLNIFFLYVYKVTHAHFLNLSSWSCSVYLVCFLYRICVRMYLFCNDMFTHLFSPFFCSCSIMAPKLLPNCKRSRELVRPRGLLSELPLQLQEEKRDCQLANIGW